MYEHEYQVRCLLLGEVLDDGGSKIGRRSRAYTSEARRYSQTVVTEMME